MRYQNASLKKYLSDLGSDLPAPGGGSASGLTAASGVALLLMVAYFTKGKDAYKSVEAAIKGTIWRLESIKLKLERLIDEDVRAYKNVSKSYKLPKSPNRARLLEKALKEAAGVPLRICECSSRAMENADFLLAKGNKNLITDVGCGTAFLSSAFTAARLNVGINLKYIKDKVFVKNIRKKLGRQEKKVLRVNMRVLKRIDEFLK